MKNLVNLALVAICYAINSTTSEIEGFRTPIRTRSPSPRRPETPTTPTNQRIQFRSDILNAPPRQQRFRLIDDSDTEPVPNRRINLDGENFVARTRSPATNRLNNNVFRFPSPMRPRNPAHNQVGQIIPEYQPEPFRVINASRLRTVIPDFEPEPFDLNDPVNHGLDINNIIKDEISQNSDDECTICFEQDDRNLVVLNCNHVFHRDWYFYIKVVWKLF